MIAIQLLLILAILFVLVKFLSSRNSQQTQAWKKIMLLVLAVMAIVVVISPDTLNGVAHLLGVGRGADLLLYGLAVAFIFSQLNNYTKTKEEHKTIVVLARKIAIMDAQLAQQTKQPRKQQKD